ncbi:MAG: hypothetical protein JWM47_977 [Acidimicrobiales bacterium]|nr:hypothetical protein [Acidimicrobiales bacterium]
MTDCLNGHHGVVSGEAITTLQRPSVPPRPRARPTRPMATARPGRVALVGRHPLVAVAVVAGLVAVAHGVWIWNHRHLGALDPDESGYIATALRYNRLLWDDPLGLPRAIGGTGTGPLIPLLSVPLLWLGPDDVRTVLLMQPLLMVATAVSGAGIARRLAGPWAAIATGVVFATVPTVAFATQTYWLGLGAAAFMTGSLWALLASERLTNRSTYAYGACIGAMLLCRTMTLGFLPAVGVAGMIVAGRSRASWIGLVKAGLAAVVIAGPWWLVAREAIFGYLFSYGYGERAGLFGDGGPVARLQQRTDAIYAGIGPGTEVAWLGLFVALVLACRRWQGWPETTRGAVAIGAAVVLGVVALASTSNNGVWFELPLIALVIPLVVSLASKAGKPLGGLLLVPVLLAGGLQLACAWWIIPPTADGVPLIAERNRVAQYEYGFEQYDARFGPFQRRHLRAAARDWWSVNSRVERYLRSMDPDGRLIFTMSGNFQMFNSNSVQLAGELRGWTPRIWVPDTVGSVADRSGYLTPTAEDDAGTTVSDSQGPVERVLVLAVHDQHLFTPDERVATLYREARQDGWVVERTFALPGRGSVHVLRHADAPRPDGP